MSDARQRAKGRQGVVGGGRPWGQGARSKAPAATPTPAGSRATMVLALHRLGMPLRLCVLCKSPSDGRSGARTQRCISDEIWLTFRTLYARCDCSRLQYISMHAALMGKSSHHQDRHPDVSHRSRLEGCAARGRSAGAPIHRQHGGSPDPGSLFAKRHRDFRQ